MDNKREFLGIWIPKEIWLNKDLSINEKCLLVEIQSLDTEETHCYASNEYFAEFFQCSIPTITRAITKLKNLGYIETENVDGRHRIIKMISLTNQNDEAPSSKCSTNNIINNKVNNNSSSITTTSNLSNTKNNFTETKNYSAKINTTKDKSVSENEFDFGIQTKTRKPNMYDKCLAIIDDYTNDSELRKLLIQYLNLRLEMSDKPLKYANQWKGLLNLLSRLSNSIDDQKQIVNQSIIKGWGTFVEIKDYNRKGFNENIHHTEPEHKARKDMTDEEWYESRAKNPDGSLRVY